MPDDGLEWLAHSANGCKFLALCWSSCIEFLKLAQLSANKDEDAFFVRFLIDG